MKDLHRLGTSDLDGFEPFGWRDGVSQPLVEGLGKTGPENLTVKAGEFVLGYPNEYGLLTGHPPLGRNGSYLVFRQLAQDVRGFWRYLDGAPGRRTPRIRGSSAPGKFVGRWPSGAPLVLAPEADEPARGENDFRYHRDDARGALPRRLPHPAVESARLARPGPGSDDSLELNRRHRPSPRPGVRLAAHDRGSAEDDGEPRGLHFICLSGNIARQFEFVQTWLNNPSSPGSTTTRSAGRPVRAVRGCFTAPGEGIESATRACRAS